MMASYTQFGSKKCICDVCGIRGDKDKWYLEPRYERGDLWSPINIPHGERGTIGHREKIILFPNTNGGFHHLGICCCSECHTIVADLRGTYNIFKTREKLYEYVEKRMMFRAMAKNTTSKDSDGIVLYTHYNRNFTKGLIVKIPGSDEPSTKNNLHKLSNFKYFMVTGVYTKETKPKWSTDKKYTSRSSFDYYVEVVPYETALNAYNTIVEWWKHVRYKKLESL